MKTITKFPRATREIENIEIPMKDGTKLAARIWLPKDAEKNPVPAILEYLPYRKRDGTFARDELTHPYFAGHGYAGVRVDMRGNGESEGIMLDEYVKQEQDDALEVIEWLTAQKWCSGAVGMIGISWGGFNGLQVAARKPKALKAVITLCSTDDRYEDDIHYKGGTLLNENLGWAATMFAYSSRPPDPALVGKAWKKMWMERLENEPFLLIPWLKHRNRDSYWKHGSICEDWSAIECPVLAVGGWNDAYSNAIPRMMANLKVPRKAIIGPWAHKYPHFAVPEPRIGFLQEALRWWDKWLKGIETGVEKDPNFRAYVMDGYRAGGFPHEIKGRWIGDESWPPKSTQWQRLFLNKQGLGEGPVNCGSAICASPQNTGQDGGEYCIIWLGPEFPGDQRRDDGASLTFDSEVLTQDSDIVGQPMLSLCFTSDKPVAQVAVRLNDVWPDGASSRITYHLFNLTHRNSHELPEALEPGKEYTVKIKLDDIAWRVAKGHRLRVSISTSYWPLMWPSPEAASLQVKLGKSFIDIPIRAKVKGEKPPKFAEPEGAKPARVKDIARAHNQRIASQDQRTGVSRLEIVDDFGRQKILGHNMEIWAAGREYYSIHPDDPLSACQETHWSEERSRGSWHTRTETYGKLTASKSHYHVEGRLEAYEGKKLVFKREWKEKIPRKFG